MNTTIKLLNDSLVSVCRILDELFQSENRVQFILSNTSEIDMALTDASETLATIKPEDIAGNTWTYKGLDSCPGGSCAWDKR